MADRSYDEFADALARMSSGQADPDDASHQGEHADESAVAPPPPPAPPAKPAGPKPPVAAKPLAPSSARPATPRPAAPGAPSRPPVPASAAPTANKRPIAPGPVRPQSPGQPASPVKAGPARPASPAPARSARPTAPGLVRPAPTAPSRPAVPASPAAAAEPVSVPLAEPVETEKSAAENADVQDDDDSVIVPAAPLEYLGHAPVTPHRSKSRSQKIDLDSLKTRRMMIPIFLTAGLLLLAAGTLKFIVGSDAPLSDLPGWISYLAWAAAVMMIAAAILNMMRVRNQLARSANEP